MIAPRHPAIRVSLTAASLSLALMACGCSSGQQASGTRSSASSGASSGTGSARNGCAGSSPTTGPVGLVMGVRANSAAPLPLDPSIADLLSTATAAKAVTVVVDVDGSPHNAAFDGKFSSDGSNPQQVQQDLYAFQNELVGAMSALRPKRAEADDLTALETAASAMRGPGTIVFADSGLQTLAPLDFTKGDLLVDSPQEIVEFLAHHDLVPKLAGDRVRFVGLGAVTPPQQPLDQAQKDELTKLWTAIVTAGGACVQASLPAPSGASVPASVAAGYPKVSTVPIPPPPTINQCGTTVLQDTGTVGFTPGTADFRDSSTAQATLSDYAAKLQPYEPDVTVQVVGTTATWGSESYRIELSTRRAQTVAARLERLGIPSRHLIVKGVGTHWRTHVNDLDSTGSLIPQLAEQNRSVVLVSTCGAPPAR